MLGSLPSLTDMRVDGISPGPRLSCGPRNKRAIHGLWNIQCQFVPYVRHSYRLSILNEGAGVVYSVYPRYGVNKALLRLETFVERDRERGRRRLHDHRASISTSTILPMRGNVHPDGLYYVSALVGDPPLPYYLDVDTGSDLTWLQCDAPCTSCAKGPHPLYKPKSGQLVSCKDPLCAAVQAGHSYDCPDASQQCDYDIEYADHGSSMGVLTRDRVQISLTNGTALQANSVFGCAYDQQGSLADSPAPTDGVLGLSSGKASLPSQWAKRGLIKNVIGHCIAGGGRDGGYMFFGDDLVPVWGMAWVPMLGKPSMKYYYAGDANLNFGNRPLLSDREGKDLGGVIFDSGSSFTYLTNQAYVALVSAVKENLIGKQLQQDSSDTTLPLCWRGQRPFRSVADVRPYFKSLTLNFKSSPSPVKSKQLEILPEGYLIISSQGNVCLGVLEGSAISYGNFNIIGGLLIQHNIVAMGFADISLQGYLVVYDNDNSQIGWARTDCHKPPKFGTFSFS
eukprot:Gb_09760 [translate_table: standard]